MAVNLNAVKADENLGKRAKDKVTGLEGIIIGVVFYLFGCKQYGIVPEAKDNVAKDAVWYDEGRIEITGPGIRPNEVTGDIGGGFQSDAPRGAH